jgi:energy-converting hydrogenase Eha subunit C
MKKCAPLLLCLFIITQLHAQNWQWARAGGGIDDSPLSQGPWESWAKDMTVDKWGNVYTVGFTFDQTQFTGTNSTFPYYGGADAYIVKYDKCGNFVWAMINGGDGGGANYAVASDTSGNIYVQFEGFANAQNPVNIHTSLTKDSLIYTNGSYLMKYDPNGNLLWMDSTPVWGALSECLKVRADGKLVGIFQYASQGGTWQSFTVNPLPVNRGSSLALVLLDPQTGNVIKGALLDTLPYGDEGVMFIANFSMDENDNIYLPVQGAQMIGEASYPGASFLGQVFTIPLDACILLKIDKNFNLVKYQFDDNSSVTNSVSYSEGSLYAGGLEFAYSNYVTDTVGYLNNIAEYRMYKLDTGTLAPVWESSPIIYSGDPYETYVVATSKHVYMLTSYSGELVWGGDTSALSYRQILFDLNKATGQFDKYIIDSGSNGNTTTNMIMADAQENLIINGQFSGTFTSGPNTLTPWGGSESPIFFIEKWGVACGDTLNTADNPYPPTNLITTTGGTSSINLQWADNSPYRISFHIYRSPNGITGWQLVDTTIGTQTTLVDTGLASNTWYWYYVVAWNNAGESDSTNIDSAKTLGPTAGITITGPDTLCANRLTGVIYTATTVAGNTYAWTITGGTITSGASTSAATVTWNSTGPYKLKIAESNGGNCTSDSITSITVKPVATSTITQSICPGQSFDGYTTGGTHVDTFTAINGCDSIRTLQLMVLSFSHSTITQNICPGQSYLGYNQTGTYIDTLHSGANGCDSIRTVNLTVLNNVQTSLTKGICQGQIYDGHSATGTYIDTFNAANTCDSICTLYLTVSANIQITINQTICAGHSFDGFTQTGTYIDTFTAIGGCDSVRTLNLTVLNNATSNIQQIICQGQQYGGHSTTGNFVDTLQAANTCDSIRTLQLTVIPITRDTVTKSICAGQSYAGYSAAGHYVDTFQGGNTCDSIRMLNLIVLPVATSTISQIICQGQSYDGHSASGTYVDTFNAANSCDSIRTLILTVTANITTSITKNICQGQLYYNHDSTGVYVDSFTAVGGCDSVRTLHLTVTNNVASNITTSICPGQNYYGHTATGTYVDSFSSVAGCDSIRTLQLIVNPIFNDTIDHTICQGDTFNGHSVAGYFTDTLQSGSGCDSIVSLALTVNPAPVISIILDCNQEGDGCWWSAIVVAQPVNCDSIHWQINGINANNVTGDTLSFTSTEIINFNLPGAVDTVPLFQPEYIAVTGFNGCGSFTRYDTIMIVGEGIHQITAADNSISLYPNPTTDQLFIKTENINPQTITIYDVDGRLIFTEPFKAEISISQLSSGVYFVEVQSNEGVGRKRFVKM